MKRLLLLLLLSTAPAWATQYVVPDEDLVDSGWDSFCPALNDYDCIDDAPTPDDDEYGIDDDGDTYTFSGSAATDPGTDSGFRICMRHTYTNGNGTALAQVRIYDHDDNLIETTGNQEASSSAFEDYCQDIADASGFDATDFAGGWYFYVTATSSGTRDPLVSEVWMEVPDAAGAERRVIMVN